MTTATDTRRTGPKAVPGGHGVPVRRGDLVVVGVRDPGGDSTVAYELARVLRVSRDGVVSHVHRGDLTASDVLDRAPTQRDTLHANAVVEVALLGTRASQVAARTLVRYGHSPVWRSPTDARSAIAARIKR